MATAEPERSSLRQPDVASPTMLRATDVVHAVPLPAFMVDVGDRIVAWNPATAALFGDPGSAAIGRSLHDVPLVDRQARVEAAVTRVRRSGAPLVEDVTMSRGGSTIRLRLTIARVVSVDGAPVVLVVAEDCSLLEATSRLDRAQRERDVLRKQLDGATRALDVAKDASSRDAAERNKFLAMLAHELRNPLAAMTSALYVVKKSAVDGRIFGPLGVLERQIRHMTRMLDGLLDLSRVTLGKIDLDRSVVDLRAVVADVVEARRSEAESRTQLLSVALGREPVCVLGDRTRLQQVVENLVGNALKYTPTGGEISVDVHRHGDTVRLRVADTGVGIPPTLLPKIFDLFTQGDRSLARSEGGLGIGLTLVRLLVEMHGGRVEARSAGADRGAELVVRLPLAAGHPDVAMPGGRTAVRAAGRVLVVDDNADARRMLERALALEGYVVDTAADAREALRLAMANAPNAAIIDIGLPGIDGYELARRIRTRLGQSVRLVALTGYGDDQARASAEAAGYDAHLVKPVAVDELVRRLVSIAGRPT